MPRPIVWSAAGMSKSRGQTSWLYLEDTGDGDLTVEQRDVPFDVDAVVSDLRRRRHPNTDYMTSVLTGDR
jgi:hypothetical protein